MTQKAALEEIVTVLDRKKSESIKVLKITELTIIADYFIIAGGTSVTQARALADEVEYKLKQQGLEPLRIQGNNGGGWIIIDYGDIVVHVFSREQKDFYDLERLWRDGEEIDINSLIKEQ